MCLLYGIIWKYSNQYPFCALTYTRTCLVQCTPEGPLCRSTKLLKPQIQVMKDHHHHRVWKLNVDDEEKKTCNDLVDPITKHWYY